MKIKIIFLFLLGIFAIYPLAFWYDLHKIESFCGTLSTETKVENLIQIAKNYGVESKHLEKPLKNGLKGRDGLYVLFVASAFTMGDTSCDIKHNGKNIITAKYATY